MTQLRKSLQADITGQCGARTRSGEPCRQAAGWGTDHPGVGRCKLHGGATPRGLQSPHFRHGPRCRYLAPVLKARDEECPVTLEDLESGIEEAVGIIHWARELATSPGEVPPPMVIHALTCVINAKLKVKELA